MRVTFTFSDKSKITLDKHKAEQVMVSEQNIVMISDEQGRWTGLSINKSFIVNTVPEHDDALGVGTIVDEDRQLEEPVNKEAVIEQLDKLKKQIYAKNNEV